MVRDRASPKLHWVLEAHVGGQDGWLDAAHDLGGLDVGLYGPLLCFFFEVGLFLRRIENLSFNWNIFDPLLKPLDRYILYNLLLIDLRDILSLILHRVVLNNLLLPRYVLDSRHWLILYDCLLIGQVLDMRLHRLRLELRVALDLAGALLGVRGGEGVRGRGVGLDWLHYFIIKTNNGGIN